MRREQQLTLFGDAGEPPGRERSPHGVAPAAVADELRALAARLPTALHLGTSSWSFPGWAGIVYDSAASTTALARRGLQAYAQHPLLRTVGIDRTYYAPLEADDFARYADQVPDDFRFLVKAPERCTLAVFPHHERYGEERGAPNSLFLDPAYAVDAICAPVAEGLGPKAGVVVFQFPPQPAAALGGPRRFAERLQNFLAALPHELVYAVELRTASLLTPAYAQALRATGACHCLNVHPSMPAPAAQAAFAVLPSAPALVVRWMLGHGLAYDDARERYLPFDRLAAEDPATRTAIAEICRADARRRRPAYIVINNKAEGSAPLSAFKLAAAIAAAQALP